MLTSDRRLADQAASLCEKFATPEEISADLGAVLRTMAVCIMHLHHCKGGDPYEFMRDTTQQFYESMVIDAESN
jgi:hypothetical protein